MAPDLSGIVRPGDGIVIGQACAEPRTLTEALVAQRAAYSGARVFLGINYAGIVNAEHADHLRLSSYGGTGHNRAMADAGVLEILPAPYSQLGALLRSRTIPADVVMLQVSPPNARGEYSMGLAADFLIPALASARAVIAEVNAQVPWTHSERLFRKEDFALTIETSRPPAVPPTFRTGELELSVAKHAAAWIPEGATLEFGLGVLPDAVCAALSGRKGMRIHTGTLGDAGAELLRSGVASHADCTMLIGTRKLFDFSHENSSIRLRSIEYTHNPRVLAGLDRFVALNSAVEVDLTGQVNGEVARGSYIGAVGGALDFVRAANQSPGGVSILLIPSSRIVAELSGPVATPRSEAGVVVTERGAADLRGCSLREREQRLRAIASP